jgi:hypothetical protein
MPTPLAAPPFEGEALFFTGGLRPAFLGALHRSDWAVGPYTEVAALTLRGGFRGMHFRRTSLGVAARFALPDGWETGEAASIKWMSEGRWRELYWEDRGLRIHADIGRRSVGARLPRRWLEPTVGGVAPPGYVSGRVTPVRLEMDAIADDPLAALAGTRRGILFSSTCRPPSPLARARQLLSPQPEPAPEAV